MATNLENVSYFKIETPFAADKLAALIEKGGEKIIGPYDGEEAVTLLANLDADATGTMTSALFPEKFARLLCIISTVSMIRHSFSGKNVCR